MPTVLNVQMGYLDKSYRRQNFQMGSQKFIKKLRYMLRYLPDEPYIQLNYFLRFHRRANLDNPVTFNEKLNWMKLHDHNPLYTKMVDKYEMKNYVSDIIGGGIQYLHWDYGKMLRK